MTGPDPQLTKDEEHLRLLGVFNYVFAGLSALTVLHGVLNLVVLRSIASHAAEIQGGAEVPEGTGTSWQVAIVVVVVVVTVLALILAVLSYLNARRIRARRDPRSSRIVAGLQCLAVPLGTALGVFTFVVLGRPSVTRLYDERE